MVETVWGMTDLQIRLFTAVGQIFVAIAVGLIAFRQARIAQQQASTARKKLLLDLFERRIETFDRIQSLLDIVAQGYPNEVARAYEELFDIAGKSGKIRWLFGPKIQKQFNDDVLLKFQASTTASEAVGKATSEDEHRQLIDARDRANEEMGAAWRRVSGIFASSLTLLD